MDADERRAWAPVIRIARQAAGLTIEELARLSRTTRQTIGALENGRSAPQEQTLVRILDVLGLSPAAAADPDVEAFVGRPRPLLQRIGADERRTVMTSVVEIVARALEDADAPASPEAWVARWLDEHGPGPWSVKTEWAPTPGGPRVDLAIFDSDDRVVQLLEVKNGKPNPVAASTAEHQLLAYVRDVLAQTEPGKPLRADIFWVVDDGPSGLNESGAIREFVDALAAGAAPGNPQLALAAWDDEHEIEAEQGHDEHP